MRRRSVPSKQVVQGDAGSEVFQDEKAGIGIGGDDARREVDSEILAEELERSQLVKQPPWGSSSLTLPVRYPLDDDGARKRGSTSEPDPAAGLAHLGEDVYGWTGPAAAVVFIGMIAWTTVAIVATRRG